MSKIAFLGLGLMGEPMAHNLVKAGHEVTVYNRTAAKSEAVVAAGATAAPTPRDTVAGADIIISMVANDGASQAIWLGDDGILAGATAGVFALECSTLSPEWSRTLAAQCETAGLRFVDSPVLGSTEAATQGILKILVGGNEETVEALRPVLLAMGNTIIPCGATGMATKIKLVYNAMIAIQLAALGEAVGLAEKAGISPDLVGQVLGVGSIASPLIQRSIGSVTERNYDNPAFLLQHMRKDVNYALKLGEEVGADMPIATVTHDLYHQVGLLGYDDANMTAVAEVSRR